jgi:hypothetical protein
MSSPQIDAAVRMRSRTTTLRSVSVAATELVGFGVLDATALAGGAARPALSA